VTTATTAAAWAEVTATTAAYTYPGGHFYLNGQIDAVCGRVTAALTALTPARPGGVGG